MEELLKSLIYIQQNLNAPKGQYNNFGKFNYRSLEDIEAAIKPLLAECSCGIRFSDEIEDHIGRTFLKTTLTFFNTKGDSISTTAVAENVAEKSGMDGAQITGAASSYARKYAMNALFAIDDTKDADTDQYVNLTGQQQKKTSSQRKTTTSRRTSQTTEMTKPQASYDPNAHIKTALSLARNMNDLMNLYQQYKTLVDTDPSVKELFTQARINLNKAA